MTALRPAVPADLPGVLALNNAAPPAVNRLDLDDLEWFAAVATWFSVVESADRLVAFLIGLSGPGLGYESDNWRWFSDHYPDGFAYVDRVVVDPGGWGQGFGRALYDGFAQHARTSGSPRVCAEVNVRPRNERSLDFHDAYGFEPVGEQETGGGAQRVVLLSLEIS